MLAQISEELLNRFLSQSRWALMLHVMPLQELTIAPGENANITVTALPTAVGVCEDTVICQVVSSPVHVEFKLTCMGAKPQIDLQVADCPIFGEQQASKTKGGAHARADRSRSPAKGARARRSPGDENVSAVDADAKRVTMPTRRPSSTSLRARPGLNQAQVPSTPPRPTTSSNATASTRRLAAQSQSGGRPTRQPRLSAPKATKKPAADADAPADPAQAGTKVDDAAAALSAAASAGKPAGGVQPTAAKLAAAAPAAAAAAAGKGKKGAPAVPEPVSISLEDDQGLLEGTSQVQSCSKPAHVHHNHALTHATLANHATLLS